MLVAMALLAAQPQTIDAAAMAPLDAMALKSVLPESERIQVVGGDIRRVFVLGSVYSVAWWTEARLSGPFCERSLFSRRLVGNAEAGSAGPKSSGSYTVELQPDRVQFAVASADGCSRPSGWATPLPGQIAVTLSALQVLVYARRAAGEAGQLPFAITCSDETATSSICDRPRETLANLPLQRLATPSVEPQSYRDAPLTPSAAPSAGPRVRIRTALPPRVGEPVVIRIPFAPGDGEARTLSGTLRIEGGRLVSVSLNRSTVIYH